MPEEARSVARELNIPYYETSVLTYFGIDQVFENAIRAALCCRRQQSLFRMTSYNLRRVLTPILQEPFCPPRPSLPEATSIDSSYLIDLLRMARQQNYTDLIFLCGSVGFSAHRFMMASASPLLRRILTADYSSNSGLTDTPRSNSETSLVSSNLGSNQLCSELFNEDTECLIPSENPSPHHPGARMPRFLPHYYSNGGRRMSQTNRTLGGSLFTLPQPQLEPGVFRSLNYPALQSLKIERVIISNSGTFIRKNHATFHEFFSVLH